ncbi:IcmK (plasmid) [Pseudomonas sp. Leaf58]|uniref:DotH/IcmK family type IV secretion protein n=1 Tax=unclassified Pseudomonas TaxID=196821 RepID=UPI0006FBE502|nr:DotH/IcmK family type IV secretion protein [Pseudomonas sp. Leaf58]AYG47703.1 IcmK [Pseudomonas sp. Leaf58]KQN62735.1 hypothetical protein ASF02_11360 [Pseudomonas sp. Leaf58]
MRKTPLAIALLLILQGSHALAAGSFDNQLNETAAQYKIDPADVTNMDRQQAAAKKGALAGYLNEKEELKEIRQYFNDVETSDRKKKVLQNKTPMEPSEIRDLRKRLDAIDKASNESVYGDASIRIRNVTYNPDSNQPLVISIAPGYAAQVEFYDASGQPWSIKKDGVLGDGQSFSKKIMGEKHHISSFTLNKSYKASNAAIVLDGLNTTIPVVLKGTASTVDSRVSVTIPKLSPNATIQPVFQHEMDNVSDELVRLQGGDAPAGSKTLSVAGLPNSEAWFDGKFLYLSLPGRLLLPPPINSSISPTGRFLYKVNPTTYISMSLNGERRSGTIQDLYSVDIQRAKTVFDAGVK